MVHKLLLCIALDDSRTDRGWVGGDEQGENFPGRLLAGLLAFVKAVEANPEVWIPLMAQLAAKPEARALGCEIGAALAETYCNATAEAFFLYISKQLHDDS